MKRKKLAYIESVQINFVYMQAFQYFLTMIWEDVEVADVHTMDDQSFQIDLAISEEDDSHLIMHLWEDWKSRLMHNMYAVKN